METDVIREIKRISLDDDHRFSFIAKYIINNITMVPDMGIRELAQLTYSSTSTLNRFTKYLQLSGYKELIHVIKYFNYTLIESSEDIRGNTENDIIYQTYHNVNKSIQDTFNLFLVQNKVTIQVVDYLKKAKKINIFAVGGTFNLAKDFQQKLLRIGLNAIACNNFHNGYFLAKQSDEETFNIVISYSGETRDLINLALVCKEKNSKILAISKKTNNSISKVADFKLVISSNEPIVRTVSITSRLALMFCLDLIFYKLLLTDFDLYKGILQATSLNKF